MGEHLRALLAAEVAYRDEISLENYQRVAEIAGQRWPERRTELLDYTRSKITAYPKGQVDVLLSEGLVGDAIAILDTYASHTLVEQVVDAALEAQSHQAFTRATEYIQALAHQIQDALQRTNFLSALFVRRIAQGSNL